MAGWCWSDAGEPPDHGYSWVILAVAFLQSILLGIQFAPLGVLIVEFSEYFDSSKVAVTWIGSFVLFTGYGAGMRLDYK